MKKALARVLTSNVSGLSGDVSKCQLTAADRAAGININDLVKG